MRQCTMHGNPLTLLGTEPMIGDKAPDFTVLDKDLKPVKLSDYLGSMVIINAVPSVDTPVCDAQVRRFNLEATKIPNVNVLSISVDLPFALTRYCAAADIDNVVTLSDHKDLDFGMKYGLVLEDLRLLSRAVLIINEQGILTYKDYVSEITHAPDYDAAIVAIKGCL